MSFYKRFVWVSMSTEVGDINSIGISLKLQFVLIVKIETTNITKSHNWVKKMSEYVETILEHLKLSLKFYCYEHWSWCLVHE